MKKIIIIFKKELIDSLRDRRTLITMVVIPLLLFPLLMSITSKFMLSQAKMAREKVLQVVLISNGNGDDFRQSLQKKILPGYYHL